MFLTCLTGGCNAPLWTWKINAWGMLIWYHGVAMGLLVAYIPKSTNILCMTLQWHHNCRFCPNCWFSVKYSQKWIFLQKVQNIWILPDFLLMKEGNDHSNIYCKIQDHTMKIFSQNSDFWYCQVAPTPLTLWLWWLTTPGKVVPLFFFHQNDRKDVKEIT